MGINFLSPLWLILLPISLVAIIYTSKTLSRKDSLKKNIIISIRIIVATFLILALSNMGLIWTVKDISTIFLIDVSDSIKDSGEISESFVDEALKAKTDKDSAGIILFAEDPMMESFLSKETISKKINYNLNGNYTNIEKAITMAISVLPDKSRKRIVLITDGEENQGDSSNLAGLIKEKDIDLKVFKVEKDRANELAITNIWVPDRVSKGEEYNIIVNIKSNFNTKGILTLFDGNEKAMEERVEISKGNNRYVFRDKSEGTGFKTYRAAIEAAGDKDRRNNEAGAIINVLDEPLLLLLEGSPDDGEEISKMMTALNINYKRLDPSFAPSSLQSLMQYKSIILSNVSVESLNNGFLNSLESYVKDFAGGLIAIGGDDSFALGAYYKTSLEKVLPVNMELKGEKAIPDMSIILVIDKSGSMSEDSGGISRVELAKEAASRVLDSLRDEDSIGVLAFDDAMYWVVEPQKMGNREEVRNRIGSIRASGGTSILPPLKEAVKTVKKQKSTIKHIILLTDGQAEKTGYDSVLEEAVQEGISVSTVAVGRDADANLLQYISEKASGRFYLTDEFSNLPSIFAKETYMATKSYLNNRTFIPGISSLHSVIADFADQGLPALQGYIAASPKDRAKVILESDTGDPILTFWQYGLGKTVAWNSDMSGKWSGDYINWKNNLLMWNNIINWTIENYENDELEVDTQLEGGYAYISVKQRESKEEFDTKAIITTPSLKSLEVNLEAEAPGQYGAYFKVGEIGSYLIKIVQSKGSEIRGTLSTGLTIPYSAEYNIDAKSEKLDRLVYESQGKYINNGKEVYEGGLPDVSGRRSLTAFFLIAALIIFLIDIAIRRLNLPFEKYGKRLNNFLKKFKIKLKEERTGVLTEDMGKKFAIEGKRVYSDKGDKKPDTKKEKRKEKETLDTATLLKRKRKM